MHHASLISPLQQNKNPTAWGHFSKTKMLTDQFKASRWNKHQSFRPPIYIFCSLGHFAPNLSCVFHPKVYFTAVPIGIGTQLDSTDTWALIINAMAALALHHVQPAIPLPDKCQSVKFQTFCNSASFFTAPTFYFLHETNSVDIAKSKWLFVQNDTSVWYDTLLWDTVSLIQGHNKLPFYIYTGGVT